MPIDLPERRRVTRWQALRTRHGRSMLTSFSALELAGLKGWNRDRAHVPLDDIEQGADALSEIDFVRLCRRHGLPPPTGYPTVVVRTDEARVASQVRRGLLRRG